jgi:hypothetical protein
VRRIALVLGGVAVLSLGAGPVERARAAVTPIVECRAPNAQAGAGNFHVYYGYVNPGGPVQIDFGPANQVIPGFGFQGQPTVFNSGSYPRVFRATFNSNVFNAIAWDLDGSQAIATIATTPLCVSGATGPASDVTTDGVTLNGWVEPRGVDTTFYFEYGETIDYDRSTPERQRSDVSGGPVSEPITGLEPATEYHYRLVADGTDETVGEDGTFTTAALPPDPELVDLALERAGGARKAKVGKAANVILSVANHGPTAATGVAVTVRGSRKLRISSIATPAGRCALDACAVGTIPAGSETQLTVRMRARRPGRHPFTAMAVDDQPEAPGADNFLAGGLRGR